MGYKIKFENLTISSSTFEFFNLSSGGGKNASKFEIYCIFENFTWKRKFLNPSGSVELGEEMNDYSEYAL